jgi:hypothetical protein
MELLTPSKPVQAESEHSEIDYIVSLSEMPNDKLAKKFLCEKRLKNLAYSFLIKRGLMKEFIKFSNA